MKNNLQKKILISLLSLFVGANICVSDKSDSSKLAKKMRAVVVAEVTSKLAGSIRRTIDKAHTQEIVIGDFLTTPEKFKRGPGGHFNVVQSMKATRAPYQGPNLFLEDDCALSDFELPPSVSNQKALSSFSPSEVIAKNTSSRV